MENYNLSPSLRPALAGLVIDHEAGEKEAYAAFVDLVVRGHVSPVMSGGKNAFAITKESSKDLLEHEKAVMDAVFHSKKDPMAHIDVVQALDGLGADEKFQSAIAKDAVQESLYMKREATLDLHLIYQAIDEKYFGKAKLVVLAYFLCFPLICLLAILMFFVTSGMIMGGLLSVFMAWQINSFCCVILPFGLYVLSLASIVNGAYLEKSAYEKKFLPELSTNLGSAERKKYLDLLSWLKERPLSEMRWSNEFLGYSIAFGLQEGYKQFPK